MKRYIQPEEPTSGSSPGDPIVKPSWRQRLADAIRPKDEPDASVGAPAAAVTTPPAKKKSSSVAWTKAVLRAYGGDNDERPRRVEYGTDEARSTAEMLERISPRGPRA
jgi:hypothetical protein